MRKAFCLTFVDWSEERAEREKGESFHFFLSKRKNFAARKSREKTTAKRARKSTRRQHHLLLVCTVHTVRFSRQVSGDDFRETFLVTDFEVHTVRTVCTVRTVAWKSRQKTKKIRVWFLLLGMQIKTEIYLSCWDKLVWYFLCIAVNDKLLLKK